MLIEFTVGNFLSFNKPVTFTMLAAKPIKEHIEDNVIETPRYNLLKSAVIYGANASGKSNLIKAINFCKWFVVNSSKESQVNEEIYVNHYKLSTSTENGPSFFEIVFLINNIKYRYGFTVDKKQFKTEWLFFADKTKEYPLFLRENDVIEVKSKFPEGQSLEAKTRNNALFLSVVAQFNGEIAKSIINWFNNLNIISGLQDRYLKNITAKLFNDEGYKRKILELLNRSDIGFHSLDVNEITDDIVMPKRQNTESTIVRVHSGEFRISTQHIKYNKDKHFKEYVNFNLEQEESEGTKKYFNLAGPLLKTINDNGILVIDELDARLHPFLTFSIVKLFNSKNTNPDGAQLIFVSHDTNLLDRNLFRRDQIWFTEKDKWGATDLYSLADFKYGRVRKDEDLEKRYIAGKYGAIPFLGNIEDLFKEE